MKLLNDILIRGSQKFNLNIGIISRITGDNYRVLASAINGKITTRDSNYSIKPGSEFKLTETYCSDVVRENKMKYYSNVENVSSMLKHPCYLSHQLRAYIGAPLSLKGKLIGTLNYSALDPRKQDFSEDEICFIQSQAKQVADILHQNMHNNYLKLA